MSPSHEHFSTSPGRVPADIYLPSSGGKHRPVLVLHGTAGLGAPFGRDIEGFAEALAAKGMSAIIPRYFEGTGTAAGDEAFSRMFEHLPAWKTICGAALTFIAADGRFDATRTGLLGFSLGGHIVLHLALGQPPGPRLKAVVEFFAPTLQPAVKGDWSVLPPVQIHHGTSDPLSIENSRHLVRELRGKARTVKEWKFGAAGTAALADDQFIEYPGETHGFKGAALTGSRDAAVQFLDEHLT